MSDNPTVERLIEELDALDAWPTDATGEECTCAKCGDPVKVPESYDWADGDWCHACWCTWGNHAREKMPSVLAMLRELVAGRKVLETAKAANDGYWKDDDFYFNGDMNRAMKKLDSALTAYDAAKEGA